ncbi:hypothetical protein MMPV_007521 [Pyropia vietnamensis]
MSTRRLVTPRGLVDALPFHPLRGHRGRPPEGPVGSDDEDALSSNTLHVRSRLPFPRQVWLDPPLPGASVDALGIAIAGGATAGSFPSVAENGESSSASAPPGGLQLPTQEAGASVAAGVALPEPPTRDPPSLDSPLFDPMSLDSPSVEPLSGKPTLPKSPRANPRPTAQMGGGSGALAAAVAAVAAAADRPAAWAPTPNSRGSDVIPQLDNETIPVMGLSEIEYLRNIFNEVEATGRGWVDLEQFCDLCNLLLVRGASTTAAAVATSSLNQATEAVDDSFDRRTLDFLFRLVDSGRQGRVTLRDWIRASAVFCYGRLPHKLPFVFRFAADPDPKTGELLLSESAVRMLIRAVFEVVCIPPSHTWGIARTSPPIGRWPESYHASGALSVEHNPDTLWATAEQLMLSDRRMTYAAYLTWAEREPAFSEWVGWVGSRGLRAINIVQSARERAQFVATMQAIGFAENQLAALPAPVQGVNWSYGKHTSPSQSSQNSTTGHSATVLSSFEIDFKALSLERLVGEGTFAEVWSGRWLEAPVAVKIFKDRSSAVAMYQLRKQQSPKGDHSSDDCALDDQRAEVHRSMAPSGGVGDSTFESLSSSDSSARSAGQSAFFLREVELLSNLRHPNVLLYMGACVKKSSPLCIVSELVTGGSLHDAIHGRKRLKFTPIMKMRISLDVALGMLYLHSQVPVLLHRDLKSSNILVDTGIPVDATAERSSPSRVRAVLCDFGLSRQDVAGTHASASGKPTALVGTLLTMAPEIVRSERYTSAADVFSFGMVLWELWTGQVPYKGLMPAQLMYEVAIKGTRPNLGPSSGIPASVASVIRMCWQGEQTQRPQFLEIVRRLQQIARKEMGVTV